MTPVQSLIADWQHRLTVEQRRSPHSVRAYIATAHRFVAFLADHRGQGVDGAMLAALEPADLRSYLAARRREALSNTSAARELSAVRSFLRHVGGMAAAVPQVRGPRVRKGLPRPVTPDEAVGMADALDAMAPQDWQGDTGSDMPGCSGIGKAAGARQSRSTTRRKSAWPDARYFFSNGVSGSPSGSQGWQDATLPVASPMAMANSSI